MNISCFKWNNDKIQQPKIQNSEFLDTLDQAFQDFQVSAFVLALFSSSNTLSLTSCMEKVLDFPVFELSNMFHASET